MKKFKNSSIFSKEELDILSKFTNDLSDGTFLKEYNSTFSECIERDLETIFKGCINDWYNSYTPNLYKRKYSFKYMYKITINKKTGILTYDFDPSYSYARHRVSNKYLFEWGFLKGYHGGAHTISPNKIDDYGEHPEDGTPWYRTPHPEYTHWESLYLDSFGDLHESKGAFYSESPMDLITKELNNYNSNKKNKSGHTLYSQIDTAFDLVMWLYDIDYILGRYK